MSARSGASASARRSGSSAPPARATFGSERARLIAADTACSPAEVTSAVRAYADYGFTDVVLTPTVAELSQLERLADVVF